MSDDFLGEIKRMVADPTAGPVLDDLLNAEASRVIVALTSAYLTSRYFHVGFGCGHPKAA